VSGIDSGGFRTQLSHIRVCCKAHSHHFPAGSRQRGGEAAEIGDLLDPVTGICTGAGFEVTLVAPSALIARTTYA
jgi:hypothetical protein